MLQMRLFVPLCITSVVMGGVVVRSPANEQVAIDQQVGFTGDYSRAIELDAGQVVEIAAGISSPSKLPANGRIAAEWVGPAADLGIRKILHALDPDLYVVYRAPLSGQYTLTLRTVSGEEHSASVPRWRESGVLAAIRSFPN